MRRNKKPRTEPNHRRSRSQEKNNETSCTASSSTQSTPDASLLFWISALCRPVQDVTRSDAVTNNINTAPREASQQQQSTTTTSSQQNTSETAALPPTATPCESSSNETQTQSSSPVPRSQPTETAEQQLQHYVELTCGRADTGVVVKESSSGTVQQEAVCATCTGHEIEGSSLAPTHGGLTSSESNKQQNNTDKQGQEGEQRIEAPSTATHSSSSSVELRDMMPLYMALIAGELGPVVIDVQLLGNISLLQQPGMVTRVLDKYEQADSAALRRLLRSIRLFLVVRGTSFYTICPTHYPVLPLLARLLLAPSVTKVVMHLPLLFRLLFLFLGSDRVEPINVVDVEVWSEVVQQHYGGSTTTTTVREEEEEEVADSPNREKGDEGTGRQMQHVSRGRRGHRRRRHDTEPRRTWRAVHSVHDVLAVLPADVREVLASYEETVRRQVQAAQQPLHDEEEDEENDENDTEDDASSTSLSSNAANDAPHSRHNNTHNIKASPNMHDWAAGQDATTVAHCFTHLAALAAYYQTVLTSRMTEGSPAWQLAARRSYATMLCALMSYHGIFVSKARYDAMQGDLDAQIRDLCAYGDAQLRQRAVTTSTSSQEVSSARQDSSRRPARGSLMQQLSAEDVVEHVMRHCSSRTRALLTGNEANANDNNSTSATGTNSTTTTRRPPQNHASTAFVRYCLQVLRAQQQHPLHEATTSSSTNNIEGSEDINGLIMLLTTWLAIDERREYKRALRDLLSSSAQSGGKLNVRVLSNANINTTQPGTSCPTNSTNNNNNDEGSSVTSDLCVCFSVHPHWEVHGATTGRIFASMPNVQTLPKQPAMASFALPTTTATEEEEGTTDTSTGNEAPTTIAQQKVACVEDGPVPMLRVHPDWTVRHLYLAPPGCLLVSLDYNQIELRVLAHLCRDTTLLRQLTEDTDVLRQMAQAMLRVPQVATWQRQAVKGIVYGLLYGMGMQRMEELMASLFDKSPTEATPNAANDKETSEPKPTRLSARELVAAFDRVYPGVHRYLRNTRLQALHEKTVQTLSGLKDLSAEADPGRRRQNSVAWAVQGGAADILHSAMRTIHEQRHSLVPFLPAAPLALIMAVHDELVYAVPSAAVDIVVPKLRLLMEEQSTTLNLCVPLRVSVRVGPSLGELRNIEQA